MSFENGESDSGGSKTTFLSVPLLSLSSEREFPGALFICLRHKMVKYRNKGDKLSPDDFNKLVYNHVRYVFIDESERKAWSEWLARTEAEEMVQNPEAAKAAENPEAKGIIDAVADQRRAMMDIFDSPRDERQIKAAIDVSRKLVTEFLRKPFAINNIQALQKYGKGTVDHSVNVSVLSVFLGLRMGYSHQLILENLAMGGLMHDLGKILIEPASDGMNASDDNETLMRKHPMLGQNLLEDVQEVSNEVRMIVAQHHEYLDGSGYPGCLKGLAIYDLARLVCIANLYDELISKSPHPTLKDRADEAIGLLEANYDGRLDPKKLEKVIKILRYSFV